MAFRTHPCRAAARSPASATPEALVEQINAIRAQHVLWLTVPHVTIAPMLRGVGHAKMSAGSRYYARYTRPWISDDEFHANRDPCLPGDMARVIDSVIDQYNDMIVERVRAARSSGRDWRLLDIAGILDRLAYRRYVLDGQAKPSWWQPYELPEAYQNLSPLPDTRFYVSDKFGRTQGGLFALDGIHPTSIGYGIIANEVLQVIRTFGVATQRDSVDFDALIEHDTLIKSPPTRFANLWTFASLANRTIDFAQVLRHRPPL